MITQLTTLPDNIKTTIKIGVELIYKNISNTTTGYYYEPTAFVFPSYTSAYLAQPAVVAATAVSVTFSSGA